MRSRRRIATTIAGAGLLLALAGGLAYAAVPGAGGVISACYAKGSGLLRVIDADAADACRAEEQPLSWNQQGPKGDKGDPGETVVGYRALRSTPDEVAVTAVGSGPLGFPDDANPPTTIATLDLPEGVYAVHATVGARKDGGAGDFLCWVEDARFVNVFTRTSLGSEAGHARRATVAGTGFTAMPAGGGRLTLACWQAPNAALPGTPYGETPTVFYANVNATTLTRATIVRQPGGATRTLP